jgi:hypothetical protein
MVLEEKTKKKLDIVGSPFGARNAESCEKLVERWGRDWRRMEGFA